MAAYPDPARHSVPTRIATGNGVHTYPDISVACGKLDVSSYKGTDTLKNPKLLVEVLSPSTRTYDLGEKREHYMTTSSLDEILYVESERVEVQYVRRTEAGWETRRFDALESTVDLACGVSITLSEMYRSAVD
jgi:Uma2 family endonuclease